MATRQGTFIIGEDGVARATWLGITEADTGTDIGGALAMYPDRTVQVVGDFTTAGAITIEGSNDGGVTYATLSDPVGNPLVLTDSSIKLIAQNPHRVRPRATAGTAVSMDVYITGTK